MKKVCVVHPFLFSFFPIIFLYSHNVNQAPIFETFLPCAVSLLFTIMFWSLLDLVFREKKKSGFIVSVFLILFFSFGHIYYSHIQYLRIGEIKIARAGYILIAMGLVLVSVAIFTFKSRSNFDNLTKSLNLGASFFKISIFQTIFS